MNNKEIVAIAVCLSMLSLYAMAHERTLKQGGSGRARRVLSSVGGALQESARTATGTVRGAASDLLSSRSSPSTSSDSNVSSSESSNEQRTSSNGSGSSSLLASRSSSHSSGSSGSLPGQTDLGTCTGSALLRRSSSGIHLPSLEGEKSTSPDILADHPVIRIPCPPDTERLRIAQATIEQYQHDIRVMKSFCAFILMAHLVHLWRIYS